MTARSGTLSANLEDLLAKVRRDPFRDADRRALLRAAARADRTAEVAGRVMDQLRVAPAATRDAFYAELRRVGFGFGRPDPEPGRVEVVALEEGGRGLAAAREGGSLWLAPAGPGGAWEVHPVPDVDPARRCVGLRLSQGGDRVTCVFGGDEGVAVRTLDRGGGSWARYDSPRHHVAFAGGVLVARFEDGAFGLRDLRGDAPGGVDVELPASGRAERDLVVEPGGARAIRVFRETREDGGGDLARTFAFQVVDLPSLGERFTLEGASPRMPAPEWCPDGSLLAWIRSRRPDAPELVVTESGSGDEVFRHTLAGIPEVLASSLLPTPTWWGARELLVWGAEGGLLVDVETGAWRTHPGSTRFAARCVQVSGDLRVMKGLLEWRVVDGEGRVHEADVLGGSRNEAAALSPDGRELDVLAEGMVRRFDVASGRCLGTVLQPSEVPYLDTFAALARSRRAPGETADPVLDLDALPGEGVLLRLRGRHGTWATLSAHEVLEVAEGEGAASRWARDLQAACLRARFSPDGSRVLALVHDGRRGWIVTLDAADGAELTASATLPALDRDASGDLPAPSPRLGTTSLRLDLDPAGEAALVRGPFGTFRVPLAGGKVERIAADNAGPHAMLPDGRTMVQAAGGSLMEKDRATDRYVSHRRIGLEHCVGVAVLPGADQVAVVGASTIRIFPVGRTKELP